MPGLTMQGAECMGVARDGQPCIIIGNEQTACRNDCIDVIICHHHRTSLVGQPSRIVGLVIVGCILPGHEHCSDTHGGYFGHGTRPSPRHNHICCAIQITHHISAAHSHVAPDAAGYRAWSPKFVQISLACHMDNGHSRIKLHHQFRYRVIQYPASKRSADHHDAIAPIGYAQSIASRSTLRNYVKVA
jgi:hypothetical protein